MRPDLALFQQHVHNPGFQTGIDNGSWGFVNSEDPYGTWPNVFMWIRAATKASRPEKYEFRFNLDSYPATAPTCCPWDSLNNRRLNSAQWPKGGKFVSNTFNPGWNPEALYAPCDRAAIPGHDAWRQQFPELWWDSSFNLTVYLHFLHHLLNSPDYAKS